MLDLPRHGVDPVGLRDVRVVAATDELHERSR